MASTTIRKRVKARGTIQGVGFRPYVFNLAAELGVKGWAANSSEGVDLELEGAKKIIEIFLRRLPKDVPPICKIDSLDVSEISAKNEHCFEIRESHTIGPKTAFVTPDIAICRSCQDECFDRDNRRYRYPFISCSHCGPRFSIIEELPYDRNRTTMKEFPLCSSCQNEYESPDNRRFHAQTNACWECGPSVELWDSGGRKISCNDDALQKAVSALADGAIVALKGIGGFQLLADACNPKTIGRLRHCKGRPDKPFALMCRDLETAGQICHLTPLAVKILCSAAAPIVLMLRSELNIPIAANVAPDNSNLGVMLAYSALHHLLVADFGGPIIATSGNRGEEPICTDENIALRKLQGIADFFLVHNRRIIRALDDSVVCELNGQEMTLRRARGYVPQPVYIKESEGDILAVGGHLKNTIAVSKGRHIILSQHIGDLDTMDTSTQFKKTVEDMKSMFDVNPSIVVRDLHPDYFSSRHADSMGLPTLMVQHHYAHVLACMAENEINPPVLGVAWDGAGDGGDGTLWGGEFFVIDQDSFRRCASLARFRLPGGIIAIREPRRTALGLLYEIYGDDINQQHGLLPLQAFTVAQLKVLQKMLAKQINSPYCSSIGRLFDGVASLLDLCQSVSFEGQAAIRLEQAISLNGKGQSYSFGLSENIQEIICIDWKPMLRQILKDLQEPIEKGIISRKFHNTLSEVVVAIAERIGIKKIVLSGGSFQNRYLTSRIVSRLNEKNFQPYWHRLIPPNDGGLALGQVIAAIREKNRTRCV